MTVYFSRLKKELRALKAELERRGVQPRFLHFGGPGEVGGRVTIPTDARSEFLANRAMGDWAETTLASAIEQAIPEWMASHYGDSDRLAAGHPDFREFFLGRLNDVRVYGKRPDLLLLPKAMNARKDLTDLPIEILRPLASQAVGSVEVRSSKFDALTYMRVRREERESGRRGGRETPSFTVKIEDLKVVYRWIEGHGVPQTYCQVFFDSAFAINFIDIFSIIGSGAGFTIESPKKSQEKATIMISIAHGAQVGKFRVPPRFEIRERVTRLGRHDAYVSPTGGELVLDAEAFRQVLLT